MTIPTARRDRRSLTSWWLLPALMAVTLAAYHPAWRGTMLWDDGSHLTRQDLRSVDGLGRIWFELGATQQYYPVVHSVFWIGHRLWGEDTLGYHLLNIILHAASAFLLALILRKLAVPWPALAAMIFAVHPIQVESVAWMSELKNTLSGALCLGAALAYLHFDTGRRRTVYALSLALFVLALLSKTVVATLPGALLVILWWQRGRLQVRRDVLPLVPFVALGAAGGLFPAWVEKTYIGAEGLDYQFTLMERVLIAGRALWFYLGKLVWPAGHTFVYPRWNVSLADAAQYLYPVCAAGGVAALWAMRRRSRAPLAVALLFAGMLFPALGFLNVYPFRYSFVADHFAYLAAIPIAAAASAALERLASRLHAPSAAAPAVAALLVGVPLASLTWAQSRDYTDAETLYRATLARNPACWLAYNNLGLLSLERGETEEGLALVEAARRLKPDVAEIHTNMGLGLQQAGRIDEAIREYSEALRLDPRLPQAHHDLATALLAAGRPEEAVPRFHAALALRPDYADALTNLGAAFAALGRRADAIDAQRRAVRLAPENGGARFNLALTLHRNGQYEEAASQYAEAIRLQGESARACALLGECLERLGRLESARDAYSRALQLNPNAPDVAQRLARVSALLSK